MVHRRLLVLAVVAIVVGLVLNLGRFLPDLDKHIKQDGFPAVEDLPTRKDRPGATRPGGEDVWRLKDRPPSTGRDLPRRKRRPTADQPIISPHR